MIDLSIVEDDTLILQAITEYMKEQQLFSDVSTYGNMEDFFTSPPPNPQLILLDLALPGMSGLEGAFQIKKRFPESEVLVLTEYEDKDKVFKAFQAGASGYILKSSSFSRIKAAILEVMDGGIPMSPAIAKMVITYFSGLPSFSQKENLQRLTERELEISKLLNEGYSYKQLAYKLNISIDTVRQHIKNIYRKLQINSRTELMRDFRSF